MPDSSLLQYERVLNLRTPSAEHVELLQSWIAEEEPMKDVGQHYLADIEPRGGWQRQHMKFDREQRELVALSPEYDSLLARAVRKSPCALFYLVSRHCPLTA
jgi:hypothetical protein